MWFDQPRSKRLLCSNPTMPQLRKDWSLQGCVGLLQKLVLSGRKKNKPYKNNIYDVLYTGPVTSNSIFVPSTLNDREVLMELDTSPWVTTVNRNVWATIGSPHLEKVVTGLAQFYGTCHFTDVKIYGESTVLNGWKTFKGTGCRQRLLRSGSKMDLGTKLPWVQLTRASAKSCSQDQRIQSRWWFSWNVLMFFVKN